MVDVVDGQREQAASDRRILKRCLFCSGGIEESFRYCPHCGKRLGPPETKWYFSRYAVMFALGTLGPFALPLVWRNPRYTILRKVVITVVVLVLTALIVYLLAILCIRVAALIRELTAQYY